MGTIVAFPCGDVYCIMIDTPISGNRVTVLSTVVGRIHWMKYGSRGVMSDPQLQCNATAGTPRYAQSSTVHMRTLTLLL